MAKKVLLVDDEKDVLAVLVKRFRSKGYDVTAVDGGRAALDHVRREHVDLVVLDIMMPDMDGTEVAEHLRDDPATEDVPIIFLSAIRSRRDTDVNGSGGPNVVFGKPYDAEALLRKAAELMAG